MSYGKSHQNFHLGMPQYVFKRMLHGRAPEHYQRCDVDPILAAACAPTGLLRGSLGALFLSA